MRLLLLALGCLSMLSCSNSGQFASFVDEYFEGVNAWSPTSAVENGFHEFDARIEDRTAAAHNRRMRQLRIQLDQVQELQEAGLSPEDRIDAEMIESALRAELFDIAEQQTWQKNPMFYAALPGAAADALIKRNFAPPRERLRSLVVRLRGMPGILTAMRDNILNPPADFSELALGMLKGSVGFFQNDIAAWAREAAGDDEALARDFAAANRQVVDAIEQSAKWIETDLIPQSQGEFRIGADAFATKLRYEEMVDIPIDRLIQIGEQTLDRDYRALLAAAREIDPSRPPAEVIESINDDHPAEGELIEAAEKTIEETRQFLIDKHIVTVPSEVRPIIQETPPYARASSFASMSTPGAYEARATEAYYYVTPVEPGWDQRTKDEHLRLFSPPIMKLITLHEAFPGHYLQFLYAPQFPTKTRKLLWVASNVEGWAHYVEQMAVEEGFGGGDPRTRIAQLQEALIRDCRYLAGIRMHVQGWTIEQATQLFMEKTLHPRAVAYPEARRGAYNPTYLYYTLGKLMIYKLRDDYRAARGADYSLEGFHNDFVRQGGLPLRLMRRIMLDRDEGGLL